MLILAWARTYKIPYVIVRPTNNYGAGQYVEKLIPKACKSLRVGKKIPLHNNGTPTRNWLHAQDTANAIITIVESGIKDEIYNICGGFEQDNLTTCKKIIKLYKGEDDPYPYLDLTTTRPGMDMRYALDDSKLRSLGWAPQMVFDDELVSIVEFYKNNFIW
jgi:dTDP-glucose 4,6-dehydratase